MPHHPVAGRDLVVRADADQRIGLGHIGRTVALALEWRRSGGRVRYVATEPVADRARQWVTSIGATLDVLDAPRYTEDDAAETAAIAGEAPVVLDAYAPPPEYRSALRRAVRTLAIIDDGGGPGPWAADLVVNQNYGAEEGLYSGRSPQTSLLLGPRFALLRPEFSRWRERSFNRRQDRLRIGVSFGGSDPADMCSMALEALAGLPRSGWRAIVAAGPANPRAGGLVERASASGRPIRVVRRPSSMARLLAWADVALLAGGVTVWEAACLGTPIIGIAVADNQLRGARALARDRLWHYLGEAGGVTASAVALSLFRLMDDPAERRRLAAAGRALVDGRGAGRVVEALAQLGR